MYFNSSLNNQNHFEWKQHVLNEIAEGFQPPASIHEAADRCSNYRSVYTPSNFSDDERSNSRTTFMTKSGRTNRSRYNSNRTRARYGGRYNKNDNNTGCRSDSRGGRGDNRGARGNKNDITCFKCKQMGHHANKCNNENEEKKDRDDSTIRTTTIASKVLYSNDNSNNEVCHDDDYNIHLDNQSNEHIFRNKNLLSNLITAKEIHIRGVNGETISRNQIGAFLGFKVYYGENAIANVLSWFKLTHSVSLIWEET